MTGATAYELVVQHVADILEHPTVECVQFRPLDSTGKHRTRWADAPRIAEAKNGTVHTDRIVALLAKGCPPDDQRRRYIVHTCGSDACLNPAHLHWSLFPVASARPAPAVTDPDQLSIFDQPTESTTST